MKRLFWLYALLSLVGCTEVAIEETLPTIAEEYYATIEDGNSRTYVDEQIRMRWTAEDCITLFEKNTYNRTFMFTGKTGANAGGFRKVSTDDNYWFGYDVDANYAVYPHSDDNTLDETDLFLTVDMPAEQTYVENSFGLGANTMVAVSGTGQLMFKNVCSYLRVRLYGNNTSVSSITLTNKGNEAIAGEAKVTPMMEGEPTCVMTGSGKSIRLTCPTPVSISSDANDPTDFWLVVPPVTLASGFTVTVENSDGKTQTYDVNKSFTFERNKYNNMVREVKIESDIPYVTFTADATQTITMSKAVETLEYSVNGGEWKELGTNTVTFGGENGNLRLRGKSSIGTAVSSIDYSSIDFKNGINVSCNGDIRTLVDYENYATVNTSEARFCNLFRVCSELTSAPKLPATILADECYNLMFSGCKNLTIAPELPATTLTYACYNGMFAECTNLTTTPELPATILTESCYRHMFSSCTSLTSAPKLPAKTLVKNCYSHMFSGCTKLNNITMLATNVEAENCLLAWVESVAYFGTFTKAKDMQSLSFDAAGIPKSWTVIDYED